MHNVSDFVSLPREHCSIEAGESGEWDADKAKNKAGGLGWGSSA
jgi:hypothetical protein